MPPQPARVLIVDDDEMIAVALYKFLADRGISADVAVDAASARNLLVRSRYAVLIMDAYLTGNLHERAMELVDDIRSAAPDSYIVVLTAYGSENFAAHVARHHRITVLSKPQPVLYLADVVSELLAPPQRREDAMGISG